MANVPKALKSVAPSTRRRQIGEQLAQLRSQGKGLTQQLASLRPRDSDQNALIDPVLGFDGHVAAEARILEGLKLRSRVTALETPALPGASHALGLLFQGFVTKPATEGNPYGFAVRLPGGDVVPVVIGEESWTGQKANLGEGSGRQGVELSEKGIDYRAKLAQTIAGKEGQHFVGRGQLHVNPANATEANPHGWLFQVNQSVMPGPRPGEARHDDPAYYTQMGAAVAYDHLARLFPGNPTTGDFQVDTSGPIPKMIRQPSVRAWEHCVATMYGFDDKALALPAGAPRQDVGAYARVLFDIFAGYQQTGDPALLEAAMRGMQAHRNLFEVKPGDHDAPAGLVGDERIYRASEKHLASHVSDDVVNGLPTLPAYLQAYAIASATKAFAITHSPEALTSILGVMKTYQKHFRAADGKGWNRAIVPDGKGMGYPKDSRLGDLANHKPWNGLDIVVAAGLEFAASLGAPKKGEPAQVAEARRLANEIILEGSEVITKQMFKEGKVFVDELLREDGSAITDFRWQQNRGVVGHNFKIAWNLPRMADHLRTQAQYARQAGDTQAAEAYTQQADLNAVVARKVYDSIRNVGVDPRSGFALDILNKEKAEGLNWSQPWGAKTSFWHQEQFLLAAYKMYEMTGEQKYLDDVQLASSAWSEGFLNRTSQSIAFAAELTNGLQETEGDMSQTGRADLGYHQGELAMLAKVYHQLFVLKRPVELNLSMVGNRASEEVSVRPDALAPGKFELGDIFLNGERYTPTDLERASLQFTLPAEFKGQQVSIKAEVRPANYRSEFATSNAPGVVPNAMQQAFAAARTE